jgi:hypothetical protein
VGRPIVLNDFNQDGKLDLVGGSYPQKFAPGNGDGTFGSAVNIYFGNPTDLQIADLNGDGFQDLVGSHSSAVFTLLGNGMGGFSGSQYFSVKYVSNVGLADFDQDGSTDLAVTERLRGIVKLYRGNGDGTFDYEVDVGTAGNASEIAVADFNRDGATDLAPFISGSRSGFRFFYNAAPPPVGVPPAVRGPLPLSLLSNPARGRLGVQFELREAGLVRIEILDLRGRRVATLADQTMPAGPHTFTWKGDSNGGPAVASGMYVVRMEHSGKVQATKAIWLGK